MSYPRDLDEIPEEELRGEIVRRETMRAQGKCDYCMRAPSTLACKFPERHKMGRPPKPVESENTLSQRSETCNRDLKPYQRGIYPHNR